LSVHTVSVHNNIESGQTNKQTDTDTTKCPTHAGGYTASVGNNEVDLTIPSTELKC